MKQIFESVKEIEKEISCFLSDDSEVAESIMIENAAMSLEQHVLKIADNKKRSVLIMCGSGNNGADGYTLSRRLFGKCKINILQCEDPKSFHCKKSFENLKLLIKKSYTDSTIDKNLVGLFSFKDNDVKGTLLEKVIEKSDVIVDCIFGTGFHGIVTEKYQNLFKLVNHSEAKRIACDIPSGLSGKLGMESESNLSSMTPQELKRNLFFADKTVSMGAYKIGLFADAAKDAVGKLVHSEIGVSDQIFFNTLHSDNLFLLEKTDAKFPERKLQNSHKGNFGHTCIISGTKCGAAILSAEASLKSGTGLASIYAIDSDKTAEFKIDPSVMIADVIPANANAFVLGPGFGRDNSFEKDSDDLSAERKQNFSKYLNIIRERKAAVVLDADSFSYSETADFLKENCISNPDCNLNNTVSESVRIVLTPHPKEFSELLKLTGFGDYSVKQISEKRILLAREFSKKYPEAVLVLKGANSVIAQNSKIYICNFGSPSLSKAGSGDVLTGIIAALLAQKYSPLDAAITSVIMHAAASTKCENNYSQTAEDLIAKL